MAESVNNIRRNITNINHLLITLRKKTEVFEREIFELYSDALLNNSSGKSLNDLEIIGQLNMTGKNIINVDGATESGQVLVYGQSGSILDGLELTNDIEMNTNRLNNIGNAITNGQPIIYGQSNAILNSLDIVGELNLMNNSIKNIGEINLTDNINDSLIIKTENVNFAKFHTKNSEEKIELFGDVFIEGNLNVSGTTISSGEIEFDNLIILNKDFEDDENDLETGFESGIEINRGISDNYKFVYKESSNNFVIGRNDDLQEVTRKKSDIENNSLLKWNNDEKVLEDSGLKINNNKITNLNDGTNNGDTIVYGQTNANFNGLKLQENNNSYTRFYNKNIEVNEQNKFIELYRFSWNSLPINEATIIIKSYIVCRRNDISISFRYLCISTENNHNELENILLQDELNNNGIIDNYEVRGRKDNNDIIIEIKQDTTKSCIWSFSGEEIITYKFY